MGKHRPSPVWQVSSEEFAQIVKEATTYSDVVRYFGLSVQGNNFKTVKRRIKEDGLDTSHFDAKTASMRNLYKHKLPLSVIMVENSTYIREHLKGRLIKENVLPYICRDCGNTGEWNGKPLVLQLEHVNGISNDHRKENLCFLCPNCHSQTATYAGRNVKRITT